MIVIEAPLPEVEFTVPGPPTQQGSMTALRSKTTSAVFVKPSNEKQLRKWRTLTAEIAQAAFRRPVIGKGIPLEVVVSFVVDRPRYHFGTGRNAGKLKAGAPWWVPSAPDIDKYLRALLDAMTGVIYHDDGQIARVTMEKIYAPEGTEARTEVAVWKLDEQKGGTVGR